MFPDNLAISVIKVMTYRQRARKISVPARNFTAIILRPYSSGKYICNNKTINFEPGSICITPADVDYERTVFEVEDVYVVYFNMLNFVTKDVQILQISDVEKYKKLFLKALEIKEENDIGSSFHISAAVYEILAEIKRDFGHTENSKDNRIIQSAEYMHQNFSNPELSIEEVAKKVFLSSAYFRREFAKIYGTSPKEYLDTLRIQHAVLLLETGDFRAKEIAVHCGFTDASYFRTFFKRKTGKSITRYLSDIKQHGATQSLT